MMPTLRTRQKVDHLQKRTWRVRGARRRTSSLRNMMDVMVRRASEVCTERRLGWRRKAKERVTIGGGMVSGRVELMLDRDCPKG